MSFDQRCHRTVTTVTGATDRRGQELYPLFPYQHGMHFQSLLTPALVVNVEQVVCYLHVPIDPEWIERAWSRTSQRPASRRTRFRWVDVAVPIQEAIPEGGDHG